MKEEINQDKSSMNQEEKENLLKDKLELPSAEKPKSNLNAGFWIALIAIFISVATAFISLYEANLMKKQQQIMMEQKNASAWPYIQITPFYKYMSKEKKVTAEISIVNKGVGPAILKDVQIYLNDHDVETFSFVDKLMELHPEFEFTYERNQQIDNFVISPQETITFIGFSVIYKESQESAVNKMLNGMDVRAEFCYCSIYNDCWKYDVNKQGAYDRCD